MSRGLENLGNTCSINTLVQCLGHCSAFRKALIEGDLPFQKKFGRMFSIGEELTLLWKQLWMDKNNLKPTRFLRALQEALGDSVVIGREQMDFTEIWMLLIQQLLEESHQADFSVRIHPPGVSYANPTLRFLKEKAEEESARHNKVTNSPLLDIIQGVQIQQIECKKCHTFYHNLEPFHCTYLELGGGGGIEATSMDDCFERYLGAGSVEGWKCDKCQHGENERVQRFWKLPQVWMLIFQRFHGFNKLHTPVDFPLEFTLSEGFEMCSGEVIQYKLKSIANHYGSLNGGHYNAICCAGEGGAGEAGRWALYDDLSIRPINDMQQVCNKNKYVYALMYERV